jgi:preprotein translocase subunit Sec61beta
MPNYETYFDVLSENASPRHVVGSSAAVVLLLALAAFAVSIF